MVSQTTGRSGDCAERSSEMSPGMRGDAPAEVPPGLMFAGATGRFRASTLPSVERRRTPRTLVGGIARRAVFALTTKNPNSFDQRGVEHPPIVFSLAPGGTGGGGGPRFASVGSLCAMNPLGISAPFPPGRKLLPRTVSALPPGTHPRRMGRRAWCTDLRGAR